VPAGGRDSDEPDEDGRADNERTTDDGRRTMHANDAL